MTDQAEIILDSISTILLNFYKMDMQPNKTFEKYNRLIFPNIFTKKKKLKTQFDLISAHQTYI